MAFFNLLRQAPRPLAFGALHSFGSAFGQTFLIALFVPFISQSMGINETGFANMYAAITIASAAALPFIGRMIDRIDMLRYSLIVMIFLAAGCFVMSVASNVIVLVGGLFMLRFAGQGLMSHVSMTSVARYFDRNRGRALAIAAFGFPMAEAIMPAIFLALIAALGWRGAYIAAGITILLVMMPLAAWLVHGNSNFRAIPAVAELPPQTPEPAAKTGTQGNAAPQNRPDRHDQPAVSLPQQDDSRSQPHPRLFKSAYIWLSMPMIAGQPLVLTALFFHQAVIASQKGIELGWFAAGFTLFAITSVLGAFGSGPLIDKLGARKLFPYHLIPLMIAVMVLAMTEKAQFIPVYMALAGFTTGFATTLRTAIVPELVPMHEIGSIRSSLTAIMVLASSAGPPIYGWLFAAHVNLPTILMASVAGMAIATLLSWLAERPGFYVPPHFRHPHTA
ncbi:nitrate/nitrite transporter [Thalassospira sp. MCCC 1A01428]|uniref:MFS transporter n=1 Tax=Thalassospira sp. MCCC 1A01428 TaxID=1470575 RepID=UPI000A1D7848|nr:MFS transporter [Thalassospira sp. MCCC 1A01428]OSQ34944.1 MFS transporter [Thalassospira sp. MCCC 1A01428]